MLLVPKKLVPKGPEAYSQFAEDEKYDATTKYNSIIITLHAARAI